MSLKTFFISFAKITLYRTMDTLKNFAFCMCVCGTLGLGLTLVGLGSCTPTGGNKEEVASDSAAVAQGNAVVEAIMSRRSIRKYKEQAVEREKLEIIVNCGINAPSGMNLQPWQVRVVDNADYIDGITEIFRKANPKATEEPGFKNMFRNAPAVIFIASPKDGNGQLDCGMLGENMLLAAQSLGLGTCCLGGPVAFMKDNPDAAPYVERLQFPEDYVLLYAIAVGYPDESPAAKPRDAGKVRFVE